MGKRSALRSSRNALAFSVYKRDRTVSHFTPKGDRTFNRKKRSTDNTLPPFPTPYSPLPKTLLENSEISSSEAV